MQIALKMKPLLVTFGLFLIWKFGYLSEILLRFSKNQAFVQTYELFFFILLFGTCFVMRQKVKKMRTLYMALISFVAGYFLSLVSILLAWIANSDQISDVLFWVNKSFGLQDTLLYYLAIPIPTLGWLLTPVAFFLLKIGPEKVTGEISKSSI